MQRSNLTTKNEDSVEVQELLSLLSDEYALEILGAISERSLAAAEIADQLDISRATVYRRLDRLANVGVVETSLERESGGIHRQQYRASLDKVVLSVGNDTVAIDEVQ